MIERPGKFSLAGPFDCQYGMSTSRTGRLHPPFGDQKTTVPETSCGTGTGTTQGLSAFTASLRFKDPEPV
jgi:hypothetical protein